MNQENIGAFIRKIRKENGLTQEQLAEKLGVSQKSISRWETGKTMPDYALLPSICEVLNINVAELLGAERIEGDTVSKEQVTTTAQHMIAMMNDKRILRKVIGAMLSVIITLICVVGLYCYEFSVSVESTADLEHAINAYHFQDEISADILERQAIGNRLFVLYGENEYPGACGLACLEKGIFGKYRIISCDDRDSRWINAEKMTVGKQHYCVTYCANDLSGIQAYGIVGVKEASDRNVTMDDVALLFKLDYHKSPFLTFTEIGDDVTFSPFRVKYYQNDAEIPDEKLEGVLGPHFVDGAPSSGTGTAELGMIYVLEGILIALGFVFVRYFLSDIRTKRKE